MEPWSDQVEGDKDLMVPTQRTDGIHPLTNDLRWMHCAASPENFNRGSNEISLVS